MQKRCSDLLGLDTQSQVLGSVLPEPPHTMMLGPQANSYSSHAQEPFPRADPVPYAISNITACGWDGLVSGPGTWTLTYTVSY